MYVKLHSEPQIRNIPYNGNHDTTQKNRNSVHAGTSIILLWFRFLA